MKLVSTLVICSSLIITPLSAQTIPYNPAVRAAPPTFKTIPPAPTDAEVRERNLKAAAVFVALGWLIWVATKGRPTASDDRPTTWDAGSSPTRVIEWRDERRPAPEPVAPPAPAISPFYGVSKGVGG